MLIYIANPHCKSSDLINPHCKSSDLIIDPTATDLTAADSNMDYCVNDHELAFIFGLLGNIVAFMVFLAPVPTFMTICKKKSSDGYQSIPYLVALSSAMLLLYYGILKTNASMIISINAIGCAIEIAYLTIYIIYASKKSKMFTLKLIMLVNIGGFGILLGITLWVLKGAQRVKAVGWSCAAFNIAVFAAPLGIMREVIRTKSVEFMPFTLSVFLTITAIMWFFYGLFVRDMFIALPNVLGFLFGIVQMILHAIYKDVKNTVPANQATFEDVESNSHFKEMKHMVNHTN